MAKNTYSGSRFASDWVVGACEPIMSNPDNYTSELMNRLPSREEELYFEGSRLALSLDETETPLHIESPTSKVRAFLSDLGKTKQSDHSDNHYQFVDQLRVLRRLIDIEGIPDLEDQELIEFSYAFKQVENDQTPSFLRWKLSALKREINDEISERIHHPTTGNNFTERILQYSSAQ